MKHLFGLILILAIVTSPVFSLSATPRFGGQPMQEITCKEALQNVGKIKVGLKEAEVKALLGDPTGIEKGVWGYNFWDCSVPPKVGEQKVVGVALTFADGAVSKIDYATICATGPGDRL